LSFAAPSRNSRPDFPALVRDTIGHTEFTREMNRVNGRFMAGAVDGHTERRLASPAGRRPGGAR
jgi:hypothetical protein